MDNGDVNSVVTARIVTFNNMEDAAILLGRDGDKDAGKTTIENIMDEFFVWE